MMNKWKKVLITITAILFIVAAGLVFFMKNGKTEKAYTYEKQRVVKLYRVSGPGDSGGISYPGKIQPVRHAELFFRVSGPVIERNLELGQSVKAGEVLMRIDPRDYERAIEKLTHELEMQKVQDGLLNIEFQRMKKLIAGNAASQAEFDSAQSKKQTSEAQIRILDTALKIANDKLTDTVLRAPFDSVVTDLRIELHEMAQANVPVVVVQNLRTLEIRANVPEGNIPDISLYDGNVYKGKPFKVTFPGRGDREFIATFEEFRPSAATESGTYEVRLRMAQPRDFLVLPGMTAEVHGLPHLKRHIPNAVTIPFSSVFQREGKSCVWVYDSAGKKLELREILPGKTVDTDKITVAGGIKPQEYIVAAGGDWLTSETKVKIMNPEVFNESY